MSNNPLSGYFRQPAIYITLPSNGKYWSQGSLEMPETGELPVYPMTAVDEITYRTPDALFNGDAVVRVIQSCIPSIKNAWGMPACDVAAILIGIRIATYGHTMDIDTKCPSCEADSTFSFDLRQVSEQNVMPDYSNPLAAGDLQIYCKPMNYKQVTDSSMDQFQNQRVVDAVSNSEMSESEKLKQLAESFQKVSALSIKAVAQGIHYIKTPNENVVDPKHIYEFLNNCDKDLFNHIRDYIVSANEQMQLKPLSITCDECGYQWQQPFTLDMADFFAQGS